MKRLALIAVLSCAVLASAQSQGRNKGGFVFGGGISLRTTSSSNGSEDQIGYNFGGALDFALGQNVTLSLSVDYNSIPFDGESFLNQSGLRYSGVTNVRADQAKVLTGFGSLKIFLSSDRRVTSSYIVLGAGYFDFSMTNVHVTMNRRTESLKEIALTAVAAQIGFGIDVPLGEDGSFFIETNLCAAFANGQVIPFVPARGGFKVKL